MSFWNPLNDLGQLKEIKGESESKPILIFKHSTRCSISKMVLDRFDRSWQPENGSYLKLYYLDLLNYREISNQVAEVFSVLHESPQVLLIENGKCIFSESHHAIRIEDVLEKISVKN